jgi:hypothetical protein
MPRNTDTLQIGLAIQAILSDSQALASVIGENKVFPVVAPEGTTFPFVLYAQTGIRETGTKDGLHDETTFVGLDVFSDKYQSCVEASSAVRAALENYSGTVAGYDISDVILDEAVERYADGFYVKELTFAITVE